ncbi:MAG: tetratricopeptide repeat protein [Flavobacterium sp.]
MFYQEESEDFEDKLSLKKFESMLKTNKILFFDSEEFENIIFHYMDTGKIILAKKAIKIAFEQHPHSINLKILQLELLIFENKLELAEKMANDLLILEPQNDEIYIQKANIFSRKHLHNEAIELLKTALIYTDDLADVYNLIGMEYLFIDDLKNAKENFILTLEFDPEDENALSNIIYCFEILEEFKDCVIFLEDYINNVNPYSDTAWFHQGRMYFYIKDYLNALRCYDYALLCNESFFGSIIEKGKTLEKLRKYEDAIATYLSSLELDEQTAFAYLRIGKCYEKLNKNLLALEFYNKTIVEDSLLAKGWLAISKLYLKQKNYQKALFNINKTLEIENENHKYWKIYAFINHKLGFYEEAEHGYRKAVEYGNSELETWLFWVDILIKIGEFERATKVLLEANEFYNDNDLILYRLAGLYYLQNQLDLSSKYLHNAIDLNFKNHTIIKKIFPNVWKNETIQKYIKNNK